MLTQNIADYEVQFLKVIWNVGVLFGGHRDPPITDILAASIAAPAVSLASFNPFLAWRRR
jgi:hypothetical protein